LTTSEAAHLHPWRRIASLLVLLAVASASGAVRAQAPADKQEALGLLHEGNRLFDGGDYQGALSRYKQAYARVPSPKLLFNVGQAERALGHLVEALESYQRFLAEAKDAPAALRAEAQRRCAELEKATAALDVSAERDGAPIAGVQISIDGAAYGVTPLAHPVRVMPGTHQVVVEPGGGAPAVVTRVEAPANARTAVRVPVPPVASPSPAIADASTELLPVPAAPVAGDVQPAPAAATAVAMAAAPPGHRGRLGVVARADLDWRFAGAGGAAALTFGVTERLEIAAGGFIWPVGGAPNGPIGGASLGGTVYLSAGRLRPLLAADGQLYFSDGPHAAARAALGVAWDVAAHLSVLLSAGVEHLFGEVLVARSKTFPVPAIGVIGRI
jgi:hypothetical protein